MNDLDRAQLAVDRLDRAAALVPLAKTGHGSPATFLPSDWQAIRTLVITELAARRRNAELLARDRAALAAPIPDPTREAVP